MRKDQDLEQWGIYCFEELLRNRLQANDAGEAAAVNFGDFHYEVRKVSNLVRVDGS